MGVKVLLHLPSQTAGDLPNDLTQQMVATGLDQRFRQHPDERWEANSHGEVQLPLHQRVLIFGTELEAGLEINAVALIQGSTSKPKLPNFPSCSR